MRLARPSRRGFLKIGSLGVGGLSLSELLRDEAKAGIVSSTKSVILIYLVGGPPHQDMFDLKPSAPAEIRGPWRPIPTNVPGIEIGEAFPMMARMMDKFTIIRSGRQSGGSRCGAGIQWSRPSKASTGRELAAIWFGSCEVAKAGGSGCSFVCKLVLSVHPSAL